MGEVADRPDEGLLGSSPVIVRIDSVFSCGTREKKGARVTK
jgi:hypothetical protein